MTLLALALAYAGFTAVCFAMDRHQRKIWRQPLAGRTATALRTAGFGLLALALWPSVAISAGSNGLLLWLGLLTAAAAALVFMLPYAPRLAAALALASPAAAALLSIVSR